MRLAIFDVDGTLTETTRIDTECFVQALSTDLGVESFDSNWLGYRHQTDSGIALELFERHLGRAPTAAEMARVQDRFRALLEEAVAYDPRACRQIPGAPGALELLTAEPDWGVAIATGGWRVSALLKLDHARIEIRHLPAAFADDGVAREDILRAALSRARKLYRQESFDRPVYVGDAVWDIRAARTLGLRFIGIGTADRAAALRAEGTTHVVPDFADADRWRRALDEAEVPEIPDRP